MIIKSKNIKYLRSNHAYSLIETMAVIAVLGIVLGLLFAYQDQGWRLFYQSYGRGLSQIKAKTAIRILQDELREANKNRIAISRGTSYGVPLPDDVKDTSPYIYFTKPKTYETTGDITAYDYELYYFAKPKKTFDEIFTNKKRRKEKEEFLVLKSIKFLNQSKFYTEEQDKTWPFLPPILEIQKSTLPEDEAYLESLKGSQGEGTSDSADTADTTNVNPQNKIQNPKLEQDQFLDHFAKLKKESRNIPLSGNFVARSLTDPFTSEEVNIYFGQDYKQDKPIKIKVAIEEPAVLFGLMSSYTEFEIKITPRN